jgi:hypothetical protein
MMFSEAKPRSPTTVTTGSRKAAEGLRGEKNFDKSDAIPLLWLQNPAEVSAWNLL